jgi:2-hydroxy-6-oxonona-2,4-dienedioate hydrolase
MQTIQYPLLVDNTLTRVIEAGSGPAVVFVHGLGARCDRWSGTVNRIGAAGYRAVTFDLPGHGLATKGDPQAPGDVPGLARYLVALLDTLGIEQAVLVGTSLGGHICAYAATLIPERVPGLMLVGALGIAPLSPEAAQGIQRSVKATSREEIQGKLKFVIADDALVTDALIDEEWRINNSPGANASFVRMGNYVVDGLEHDYVAKELAALYPAEKICLVWGAEDKAVPVSVGEQCRDLLGGAELLLIKGAAHAPYFEKPAAFDPPLLEFLTTLY